MFINKVCEAIVNLAWLNFLWILFTLLGLGILGWAPATTALLAVLRKQAIDERDFPIFQQYLNYYKRDFLQGNLIGFILLLGVGSLGISIQTLTYYELKMMIFLGTIFLMIGLLFGIVLIYIFPVYLHYDTTLSHHFQYALLIGLSHLHNVLLMVGVLVALLLLFIFFPSLFLFFGLSLPANFIMAVTLKTFNQIEKVII